jgi:hypothetical protein
MDRRPLELPMHDAHDVTLNHTFQCDASWEDMEGSDKERHCYTCSKQVHNLSAMTEHEAALFLEGYAEGEHFCAQGQLDKDGNVRFARPGGPTRSVMPPRLTLAAAALTLPMLLAGCEAEPACDTSNTTQSPQTPAGLSLKDPYHPREGVQVIADIPERRRSLLLHILSPLGTKKKFEMVEEEHQFRGVMFK